MDLEGLRGQDEEQRVDHQLEQALLATMFCLCLGMLLTLLKVPGMGQLSWFESHSPLLNKTFTDFHYPWRKSKFFNLVYH